MGSGNPIFDALLNRMEFTETKSYTGASRPVNPPVGTQIWNSTTSLPEWWNGSSWVTTFEEFKGYFADAAAINAAYPTGQAGWFCINTDTNTVWFWDTDTNAWFDTSSGGLVTSVFSRTGIITAQVNDYTWAQIDKTTSSIADITTKKANLLDWSLSADLLVEGANVIFNNAYADLDFTIRKQTAGDAFVYDAGLDLLTISCDIDLNGVTIEETTEAGSLLGLTPFSSDPVSPQANDCWILDTGSARYFKYFDGTDTYSVELGQE